VALAQVASAAATARLIAPRDFGAYAAAQALFGLSSYFTLKTLGNALIRSQGASERTTMAALTTAVGVGAANAAMALIVAEPWAHAWGVPSAERLVRWYALPIIFTSGAVIPLALLQRALRFRIGAVAEAVGSVGGTLVGVAGAAYTHDATALVIGQAFGALATMVISAVATRDELRFGYSAREAKRLLPFAAKVSAQNLIYFVILTVPTWFISRRFGTEDLGLYSRVSLLVTLPLNYLALGVTKAMYPVYARVRADRHVLAHVVTDILSLVSVLWVGFLVVAAASPVIVDVLLGTRWHRAASFLPPLAVFACVSLTFVVASNVLEALGLLRLALWFQLLTLVGLGVVSGLALALHWSPVGFLWGIVAVHTAVHACQVAVLDRRGILDYRRLVDVYWRHGLSAAAPAALIAIVLQTTDLSLAAEASVVALIVGVFVVVAVACRRRLPIARMLDTGFSWDPVSSSGVPAPELVAEST
jgi:O-antigen/teichoic acid export membrane protein